MITNVAYCQGVVVWSTKSDIKLRDIVSNKKLGFMAKPEILDGTPNKEIKDNNSVPWIIFKQKQKNICIFAFSWVYVFKIYTWIRTAENEPAKIQKVHEFSLDPFTQYICGFTFIDENFLFFEFNEDESYKPYYAVYSEKNELLYRDSIKHAEIYKKFSGIHYRTCTLKSHRSNGECILYNPESVFKVQPITLKERVLFLLSKKRMDECIELVNDNEGSLPLDIIKRVRNAHLDTLLRDRKYHEAANLLPAYLKENAEQWEHWIRRFKQK